MKKTGLLLKEKRESANLSISEVALATKINPKVLTAIENGDEAHLPAKTFLKGFLRSYALFLKMDVDEVMKSYQEETGSTPPAAEVRHEIHRQETAPSPSGAPRRRVADENASGMRTAAVVVIIILIGLIIGVRELIEKYQREKVVEATENIKVSPLAQPPLVTTPPADKAAEALTNTNTAAEPAKPAEEPTAQAAPTPTPAPPPAVTAPAPAPAVTPPPVAAAPKPAPAPVPTPVAEKPAPPPKLEKVEKPVAEKPVAEKADEPKAVAAKGVKNEIILEALDKVDVKMKIKGEIKQMSLIANQVHTIHSDQPVVLEMSDGGAVNIIVNGVERGVPGDLGKPKQISIP